MRARYYSVELMRFINEDIILGDISNSNSLNRYTYVEGNPATMIDSFGLCGKNNARVDNTIDGVYNTVKGGTLVGFSITLAKFGTAALAFGPAGYAVGAVAYAGSLVCFLMGLSDLNEGSQQLTYAVMDKNGESTNFVRDNIFKIDKQVYETVEFSVVYLSEGYANSTGNWLTSKCSNITPTDDLDSSDERQNSTSTIRVGRWMSQEEYDKMTSTGKVQMSGDNKLHVANPADINAFEKQAQKGSLYVEFDVSSGTISKGGADGWGIINGPGSLLDRLNEKKGLPGIPEIPDATNIVIRGKKKSEQL